MARKQTAQLDVEIPGDDSRPREQPASRRERAKEARGWTRRARRILLWAGAAVSVAGTAFAIYRVDQFLASDSRFALDAALVVDGVVYAPRARIEQVFARDIGRSIYLAPLAERRRSLLEIDWIKDAAVFRRWPNQLAIRVIERTPVAFLVAPGGGPPALVDAEGVIMSLPPRANLDLPALMGVTREQPIEARQQRLNQVMELMRDLEAQAGRISEINAADLYNLKITFTDQGRAFRLWLGNRNYRARVENFLKFHAEISRRLPYAQVFDLRLDDRITVPAEFNPAPPAPEAAKVEGRKGIAR